MHHCCVLVCGMVSKIHLTDMVQLTRKERGGRRATLADSASELSSNIFGRLALKVLMHYNQAMRDYT